MSTQLSPRVATACLLLASVSLAACVPDLGPRAEVRPLSTLDSTVSIAATGSERDWPRQDWWTAYGDPQLDGLVEEAMRGSPDLATALARVQQARGALQASGSALLPTLGAQGSADMSKQSYNNGTPVSALPHGWKDYGTLALSANWNLDIWGKNRALLAAATSASEASLADLRQAEMVLAAEVVSSYFDLGRLVEREAVLQESLKIREDSAKLTRQRYESGLENEMPVRQANAETARARVLLAANEEQIALRRHALAALMGAGPDRTAQLTPSAIGKIAETPIPANAGIALAGRRPDIVAARKLVEVSDKSVEYAEKSFLPDISISGLLGLTSLGIDNLFKDGSDYGSGGAAISLPIFQGGALSGRYRIARGGYDSMVANYNGTVVAALQEVADAISSRTSAEQQERHAGEAAAEAGAAYDLALQRYKAGLSTYIYVLDTQTTELDARLSALDAHFATLTSEVALKRALGGGYADETSEKAPTDD